MSITRSPRRQRLGAVTLLIGALLVAFGLLAPPAQAADPGDTVFGAGYDVYLHDAHRGVLADGFAGDETEEGADCPSNAIVDGMTGWHFVIPGSDHAFDTLDVAFQLDADPEPEIVTLTKKTDWTGFDPTTNFFSAPSGKHAYVYTSGDDDVMLLDAAAQVLPSASLDKFNLSHTCPGGGEATTDDGTTDETTTDDGTTDETTTDDGTTDETTTDDGTTDETTTDDGSDDVLATTGSVTDGTTDENAKPSTEVLGEVITPAAETLPATGANDRSLLVLGIGLIAIGAVVLIAKRSVFTG